MRSTLKMTQQGLKLGKAMSLWTVTTCPSAAILGYRYQYVIFVFLKPIALIVSLTHIRDVTQRSHRAPKYAQGSASSGRSSGRSPVRASAASSLVFLSGREPDIFGSEPDSRHPLCARTFSPQRRHLG